MPAKRSFVASLRFWVALFVIGYLAIYFRTYSIHGGLSLSFRSADSIARELVDRALKTQIQGVIEKSDPRIPPQERERLALLQAERLKVENREQYEQTVRSAVRDIDQKRRARQRYLLEADPYHYFYQTERLLETGRIADVKKAGQYFHPLMRAPHGHWGTYSLHPYVGLWHYRVLRIFDPKISLLEAVAYVPLFLTLVILLVYGNFGRVLGFSLSANAVGMMVIVLSPIFIQRSALGWFDTDPYNYIFPVTILTFIFWGFREGGREVLSALGAAFFTALYALFWTGWPFMLVLVPLCLIVSMLVLRGGARWHAPEKISSCLRFLGFYLAGAFIFLAVFLTPQGLFNSLRTGWDVLNKFALAEWDIWPNVFLTVGEANGIGLKKLIFLTGNYFTFALALSGLGLEGWQVFRKGNAYTRLRFIFLAVFSVPIFLMSLKTERFSVLFVLPLAVFAGFGVMRLQEAFQELGSWKKLPSFLASEAVRRRSVLALILFCFLPLIFLSAHVVAMDIKPIMDDVWNDALLELRAKTPENAIVNSWWPPGYFVTGVAHRAVIADGGTQHYRETYWMSLALMSEDEREAAGIIRMLDLGGDDVLESLLRQGMEVADAVELILKAVRAGREEAFAVLPASMTPDEKNAFLDKTHGQGAMPPAFILVYNDLVEQNLAVSVMARWDFRKAKALGEKKRRQPGGILGILGHDAGASYVRELLSISGTLLKYTEVSALLGRNGDQLIFKNGVRVDLAAKEAWVRVPSSGQQVRPSHFFYTENAKLVEKNYLDAVLDISVLFFEDAGVFYAVLADAALIRSMLFRLYYLRGEGLTLFKPFVSKGFFAGGTMVQVFELDRKNLAS